MVENSTRILILSVVTFSWWVVAFEDCDLIQYYFEGVGLCIYAGRTFNARETIHLDAGLPVPYIVKQSELDDYVSGYDEKYLEVTLGFLQLYNHQPEIPDVSDLMMNKYRDVPSSVRYAGHSHDFPSTDSRSVAMRQIRYGEQIFNHYGNDWFRVRGKGDHEVRPCNLHDDMNFSRPYCRLHPDCLSGKQCQTVYRLPGCSARNTELKGGRMYARRDIQEGEIIQISRALLIPLYIELEGEVIESVLWYKRENKRERERERSEERVKGRECRERILLLAL
mmetsp:Transcript_10157/g.10236  ORF Transcript_10157/g.10236 Transcript_10157/m.10236 type:complete len:280 (+) Transcript_10157:1264-2103(+)